MNQNKNWLRVGMVVLAVSSFALMGCEESTGSGNKAPEIVSITASATTVSKGNSVILIAVVTDADGDAIEYKWSADEGTFTSADNDTVTWTAHEVEEIVTLELEVNDGINISTSTIDIGVDVYVPAVQPYYMGAAACSGCHAATYAGWAETNHADARDRKLADLNGHYTPASCDECHTVGFDTTVDNGGFDENPIQAMANIQCESCHGPASAHVAGNGDVSEISVSYGEDVCMQCHVEDSAYHPQMDEWQTSGHFNGATMDTTSAGWHYGGSCSRCHTGNGYVEYVETGIVATIAIDEATKVNCSACHNPHEGTNDHMLREIDSATMAGGDVVTEGGFGITCMNCHTGRRSQEDIAEQIAEGGSRGIGPHHGNQGAFLNPDVFFDVSGGTFTWTSSNHLSMENSCVTCHMAEGHGNEPTVEACESCHGVLTDFDDIIAKEDFDGDGLAEGVQSEVTGLMTLLDDAIIATGIDTTGGLSVSQAAGKDSLDAVWDAVNAAGTYTVSQIRGAVFNYLAVDYDHSHGIHNFAFTVQLLQQSYKYLTGNDVPAGYMLASGEK